MLHIWKELRWRHKLEASALFVIIFAVFTTRFMDAFALLTQSYISPKNLLFLLYIAGNVLMAFSSIITVQYMLPLQNGLRSLLTHPLSPKQLNSVLLYHNGKFVIYNFAILLPISMAAMAAFSFMHGMLLLIAYCLSFYSVQIISFYLKARFNNGKLFILISILFYFSFFAGQFASVWYGFYPTLLIWGWGISTFLAALLLYFKPHFLFSLEAFYSWLGKRYSGREISLKSIKKIPNIFPLKLQALFEKELLANRRNTKLKRLKRYTLMFFFLLNSFLLFSILEYKEIWILTLTIAVMWVHYSQSFNPKYILPEADILLKTTPVKLRHLFLAKYFTELPMTLLFVGGFLLFLQFTTIPFSEQLRYLGYLALFYHIILFTTINLRLMFYKDARLAQYALHFTLIFLGIMILNWHLVGPIISLGLLFFFFYKNKLYFNG